MHATDSSHENAFALGQRSFNTIQKKYKICKAPCCRVNKKTTLVTELLRLKQCFLNSWTVDTYVPWAEIRKANVPAMVVGRGRMSRYVNPKRLAVRGCNTHQSLSNQSFWGRRPSEFTLHTASRSVHLFMQSSRLSQQTNTQT